MRGAACAAGDGAGSTWAAMCADGTARASAMRAAARSRLTLPSAPAEQPLDIGEAKLDIGRATVIALAAMRRRLHLAQERVHLGVVEAAAGAHAALAGERAANRLQAFLQSQGLAPLRELVGEVA